jgi:hypothetical protein
VPSLAMSHATLRITSPRIRHFRRRVSTLRERKTSLIESHAAWDIDAVHGVHAMYSGNIPRSVGCEASCFSMRS